MKPSSEPLGILSHNAFTIPILALPMSMGLFAIVLWLSWVWSESVERGTWAQRIPLFYFSEADINPLARGGRIYQRWSFALSLVVPMLLIFQMADRFFRGAVYGVRVGEEEASVVAEGLEIFNFSNLIALPGMLRYGASDGPQFFAVQAWVYALLLGLLVIAWLKVLLSIFRSP